MSGLWRGDQEARMLDMSLDSCMGHESWVEEQTVVAGIVGQMKEDPKASGSVTERKGASIKLGSGEHEFVQEEPSKGRHRCQDMCRVSG